MPTYKLSIKARFDLGQIWDYTEQNWSTSRADKYILEFKKCCQYLITNPKIGKSNLHIIKGGKRYIFKSHMIFYQVKDTVTF